MITKSQNGKHFPNPKTKKEQSQNNEFNLDDIKILYKKKPTTKHTVCGGGGSQVASWKEDTVEDT